MKIKVSQYLDIDIPAGATEDQMYDLIDKAVIEGSRWRKETDFCIDEVNDDFDHPLVGEMVG